MTKTRATYYDKLKQDNPELYWSTDIQRRMANDKKRMGRSFEVGSSSTSQKTCECSC